MEHDLQIKNTLAVDEVEEVSRRLLDAHGLTTRFCVAHSTEEQLICGIGVETTDLKNLENQLMQARRWNQLDVLAEGGP